MSFQEQDFQDFINQNYLPLAILINAEGEILTINEAAKDYFGKHKEHISEIFSDDFLTAFRPLLEECIKTGSPQRIPAFFNFEHPSKKKFNVTISSYGQSQQNNQFCLLFQTVTGAISFKLNDYKDKATNYERDLQEFVDELQTANEEINASNEELTTLNEELNNYKNHLEELVEERTNELDAQRAQLKNIINNLPGPVLKYRLDKEGNDSLLFISEKVEDMWEVSKEDALADMNTLWDITFEEDIISTKNSIAKSAANIAPWNQQWRIKTKSGQVKWLEGIGIPEKKEDGSVEWDTIVLDISDRKKAEIELKQKSALLQRTESVAKIGSWGLNVEDFKITWSQEIFNIFELDASKGTPTYKELSELFTKSSFETLDTYIERAIKKGIPYEVEVQIKVRNGKLKHCIATGYANKDQNGNVNQLYGSFQDITSLKNKDIALSNKTKLLEQTEAVAKIGSWEWNIAKDEVTWSQELFNIFELNSKHGAPPFAEHDKLFTPESLALLQTSVEKAIKEGERYDLELVAITASNKRKYCLARGYAKKNDDGEIVQLYGSFQDVTKRKSAELALQEQKKLLEKTQAMAQIGSWEWEIEGDKVTWSKELYDIFELDSDSVPANSQSQYSQIYTEKSLKALGDCVEHTLKNSVPFEVELEVIIKNGENKYCLSKGYPIQDGEGNITHLYGFLQDISKLKQTDIALRQQRDLLEQTEAIAKIGSWKWEIATDTVTWSQELFNIFEVDAKDGTPRDDDFYRLFTPESLSLLSTAVEKTLQEGTKYELELVAVTATGKRKYCFARGFTKKNDSGQIVELYGSIQDITVRKTAELALKEQKEVLEKTQAMAQIGSWDWEIEGDKVTWSKELYDIFGFDPAKGAPNYYQDHYQLYTDKSISALNNCVENAIKLGESFELELEAITASGKIKYCNAKGFPVKDEEGKVTHLSGFLQDISELKQTDIALRQQRDLLERTEAVAQIGSWEWDIVEDKVFWSDEIFRIYEMDPANGAPAFKDQVGLYSKESAQELETAVQRTVKHGLPYEIELEVFTIHGVRKFCIARGYAKKNKKGENTHLYGSFQDITHKKTAEIRWKESQEDYKAITDSVPGVVLKYQLNADGTDTLIYLSKGVEDLHEINHELALNNVNLVWERIHPDDLDRFIASIQASAEKLSFWNIEYRLLFPDGRVKWAQGRGMPKKTEEGAIVWNTLIMDITEKVIASEELKSLNDQLDLAIDTAQLGVWALDMQSGKLEWNDTHLEIYGISRDEFENKLTDWQKQLHPEDAEHANGRLANVMNGEKVSGVEFRVIRPTGEIRHVIASGAPLFSEGEIVKLVGVIIDVTTIKLYEHELIKAKEKAEESEAKVREKNDALEKANAELDRFVYSVSHDLRAPIASAVGLSELSLSSNDLEEIQHLNSLKIKTLNRLDQFIKDILDYSRNSRLELKTEPLNFKEVIDLMLIEYHQDIQEKNIDVKVNIEGEDVFYTDKLRINIILNNLLSNAFKFLNNYKDNKQIEISIKSTIEEAEILVRDNGLGIEEHRQEKIFDMFYRANDKKPGSGIGLYILKECLDKLKGEVSLESVVNQGTTFIIKIPAHNN